MSSGLRWGRRASFLFLLSGLLGACGGDAQSPEADVIEDLAGTDRVLGDAFWEIRFTGPDGDAVEPGPDTPPPLDTAPEAIGPECEPGEGCFLDPCDENADCLAGWCVTHMGEKVCTQACQDDCPTGWGCQQVGDTEPDLIFVCVSDYPTLCRPCSVGDDCEGVGGAKDACVSYGNDGAFCGGACGADGGCPAGFLCDTVETLDGATLEQCVALDGSCPCTDTSIALGLWTSCAAENPWGSCEGKRFCADDGLTDCDAKNPSEDVCNGLDDDCDGVVDEGLCDDGNPCTDDQCDSDAGCGHFPVDGIPCAGSDLCLGTWTCQGGECVGDGIVDCDDGKVCTVDSCDPADGKCDHVPVDDDCQASNNPCISQVFCDPLAGPDADPDQDGCVVVMKLPGTGCNDGDLCTTGDTCQDMGGFLFCAGQPVDFDDGNPCTTDSCDPDAGPSHEWIPGCELPCIPGELTSADCGLCGTHSATCPASGEWSDAEWTECLGEGICPTGINEAEACGNCGTQIRTCNGFCQWGAWGACEAEGLCTPGELKWEACEGLCTSKASTCTDQCQWGQWGACEQQGDCTSGAQESQACGNCGTQVRACTELCIWGQWGACEQQGACIVGAIEEQSCGDCGTQTRTCTDQCQWGAWSVCGGDGACTPGVSEAQACGNCGTQLRSCTDQCQWSAWGACDAQGACEPGVIDSLGCGLCGTQERSCSGQCQWGAWSGCGGEGTCTPGQTETEACGDCGSRTRTCTDQCQWSGWGACGGQGVCAPGEAESLACGSCGTKQRSCSAQCQWNTWSVCDGEGTCAAGEVQSQTCGDCGSQNRTCSSQCQWGAWSTCQAQGICVPGENETQACGDCGTQNRSCTGQCDWGAWSGCDGEGTCSVGEAQTQSCGTCGSQSRSCTAQCQWGAWGGCSGEGACLEGQTQTQGCGDCGSQTRICTGLCQWGAWGGCGGQGSCSVGETQSQGCGNCGSQTRTCSGQCLWGSWGACGGQGSCSPGATQSQGCGNCGTQSRSCSGSCSWGGWTACNDPCACVCSGGTCCSNSCDYDAAGTSCAECKTCNATGSCTVNKPNGTACSAGECQGGACVCVPDCAGKACGPDGCGGSCGTCGWGKTCADGACLTCAQGEAGTGSLCLVDVYDIPVEYVQGVALNWVDDYLYVVALGAEMYKVTEAGAVTSVPVNMGLPTDITFDGTNLYVTSIDVMGTNKIHKISTSGGILDTWPTNVNGEFPLGITYWAGIFRVLSSSLNPVGTYHIWDWAPGALFTNPITHTCADTNVCVPGGTVRLNGELWHSENGGAVVRRSASFVEIDSFPTAGLFAGMPTGVARSGDHLYVTASAPGRLVKLLLVD